MDFLFMLRRVALSVLAVSLFATSIHAWSGAVLLIYPTQVVFEGRDRSAEVMLTNRGDAIGTFETSWIEMGMRPEGVLQKRETEKWSIQPYIRYSPRRVTLGPGESQVIKIALRPDSAAAEGEYYTHLRILTLNQEDLDAEAPEQTEAAEATGVNIRARAAIAIPVIWRNSEAHPQISIDSINLDQQENQVAVNVRRAGPLSARAYLHIFDRLGDGTRGPVGGPIQVVIYPNLDTRSMMVPLHDGIELTETARVILSTDELVNDQTTLASIPFPP